MRVEKLGEVILEVRARPRVSVRAVAPSCFKIASQKRSRVNKVNLLKVLEKGLVDQSEKYIDNKRT